jgi:RND family efflux transporter MFP subunit
MLSRNAKRTILGLSVAVVVIIVFAAAIRHYFAARALEIRLEQERTALISPEPLLVEIGTRELTRSRTYAVRLEPFRRARVAAEATGRVQLVDFEMGDQVTEGQVLARLDNTLASLNLAAAQAAAESAAVQEQELQRRLREAETLAASRTIPETQLEAARAQLEVHQRDAARLQVELERQQELLSRHEIRAPFSGVVDQRLVEEGSTVNLNEPVAVLVALQPLRARFFVSDLELNAFSRDQMLDIRLGSGARQTLPARVTSISRSADPATGLFTVEAWADNPEGALPSGLQGTVTVPVEHYRQELFVPASAVRFEGASAIVTVRRNGEQETRRLRLGPELDGFYPVLDGLQAGELVVIH